LLHVDLLSCWFIHDDATVLLIAAVARPPTHMWLTKVTCNNRVDYMLYANGLFFYYIFTYACWCHDLKSYTVWCSFQQWSGCQGWNEMLIKESASLILLDVWLISQ
jgi:hypothetical protein